MLRPDAPALTKDGGYVNAGVSPELDELRDIAAGRRLSHPGHRRARARTHRHEDAEDPLNRVFGYYIEITRSHLAKVPAHYARKQTIANGERFVTPELAELEKKVLAAEERRARGAELFEPRRGRGGRRAPLRWCPRRGGRRAAALAEVAHRAATAARRRRLRRARDHATRGIR